MPKLKRSSLTAISGLLNGALRRHGVTRQVTAAIIVDRAQTILSAMVQGTPLESDVRIVSYMPGTLVIGCTNAAASYDIEGLLPQMLARVKEELPEAEIEKIVPRVHIERQTF